MALRFAGLGSVVERSATKAAIAQASLSAARRGARSNVAHIAPEVAAAYTLRMTRTRVVFRLWVSIILIKSRNLRIIFPQFEDYGLDETSMRIKSS